MATKITEILAGKSFAYPKNRVVSLALSIALKGAGVVKYSQFCSYEQPPVNTTKEQVWDRRNICEDDSDIINRYTADELKQILEWVKEYRQRVKFFLRDPMPQTEGLSSIDAGATLLLALIKQINAEPDAVKQ